MCPKALEPYREALRRDICSACPDRLPGGACGRTADDPCTIETNLGPVVDAVIGVGGDPSIDRYLRAVRADVCPGCLQDAAGKCTLRDLAGCKLDALILQLVEVIEAEHDRLVAADTAAGST